MGLILMTYFGYLFRFLIIPIAILLGLIVWNNSHQKKRARTMRAWPAWAAIFLHVVIAVIYTTPWDNYLVATRVWWYDPALVTGLVLGWVPIEEYTFFILQPILGGLWLLFLTQMMEFKAEPLRPFLRTWVLFTISLVWLASLVIFITGWKPGTYLVLELVWALPPIALQLTFGADILWRYRRLVIMSILPLTLFLSGTDALAIGSGTWTIDPAQSLNIFLGGILPVEEFLFFLLTSTLVTFGVILIWAEASHERILSIKQSLRGFQPPEKIPSTKP